MITILHGQDEVASRNYLNGLIGQEAESVIRFSRETLDEERLRQIVSGLSLFGETGKIVVENYLKQRASGQRDWLGELLGSYRGEAILWEDGQRSAMALSWFKGAKVLEFKVASTVFKFLDDVRPRNARGNVTAFRQALVGSSPEMVFYLLARRLVDLLSPSEKAADWQRVRLRAQVRFFSEGQITAGIQELLRIDLAQKTSTIPLSLTGSIETFLVRL